jgi:hypothetical protein
VGLPPSPVEFSSFCHSDKLSHSWLLGSSAAPASRHVFLQLTWEVGLPPSPVEFSSLHHSHKHSRFWLLSACPCSCRSLSGQAWLVYLQFQGDSPLLGAQGAPPSLQCVFIVLIAYYSVSLFSPGGGLSVQGTMLFWPRVVCGSTMYCLAHLVQAVCAWVTGSPGALLVSPFNVKWRFSEPAGGVEGSKFCLFSVVLPASISPRFCYRRHAFCFLHLAAILEFLPLLHSSVKVHCCLCIPRKGILHEIKDLPQLPG